MKHTALILCLLCATPASAQTAISTTDFRSNVFADQEVAQEFMIQPAGFKGRLAWTFAAPNGRVFDRGRGEIAIPGDGKRFKITLRTPPLNPGVVQEASLTLALFAEGKDEASATLQRTLWIFPADPFAARKKTLEDMRIKVYDPDSKTRTATTLKKMNIPFEELPRAGAIDELEQAVVIIGEGVALQEEPDLLPALTRAAGRGVRVVCLAPASGAFALPGAEPEQMPSGVHLARPEIVRKLDKRLDPFQWSPGGAVRRTLALKAEDGRVQMEVLEGTKGWAWLEAEYASKGRLIVTTLALIDSWDAGPTPRYLLLRILDRFDE